MSRRVYAEGYEYLAIEDNYIERLEELSKKAKEYLKKGKYKNLQRTKLWKEARDILIQYNQEFNEGKCRHCGKILNMDEILHHEHYFSKNLFNLDSCSIICSKCHAKSHYKKWIRK